MNLINLSVEEKNVCIKLAHQNLTIPMDAAPVALGQAIEQLRLDNCLIEGIVAELPCKSAERLHSAFKQFGKMLSEKMNMPIVYTDEASINRNSLAQFEKAKEDSKWQINYFGYTSGKDEYAIESLLTTGNGFIGLRGTTPEMQISDDFYPATYIAGLYNEADSIISGQKISNEDFVNAPNLQALTIIVDGERLVFSETQVQELTRSLDLRTGLFTSQAVVKTLTGKELLITTEKFVSIANRHHYGLRYQITPLNFSGGLEIISEADGGVFNYNVPRYRSLNNQHLEIDEMSAANNQARMMAHTKRSHLTIFQESKLQSELPLHWMNETTDKKVIQHATVEVEENQSVTIEKLVFVDLLSAGTSPNKISGMKQLSTFDEMFTASKKAWQALWQEANIEIEGDMMSEKMLHLHTFHLLASGSPLAAKDIDASVTARGLHGEAYRGHIFWDELFILPFYILHFPQTAKELLMYRYRRLEAAKTAAKSAGYHGAMFPWQSGADGREQSQEIHLNPISGKWDEDHSRLQRHVSLAVAYNLWLYYENTLDVQFMQEYGLEMLLEVAKFWISIAAYDETTKRYSIDGVMGPDEFHEAYPDADVGGLKDNAYTNMMVVWLFEEIQHLFDQLPKESLQKVQEKTHFTSTHSEQMERIMHQLNLEINDAGIIAQFAGYFDLKEVDWEFYQEKYGDVHRMDRLLRAEGHSADAYQVTKQADSLMIFYNFGKQRINQILADLGYALPADYLEKNLDYYLARTSHGSTLSRVVHAQLAEMVGAENLSWQLYQEALYSDYQDIQGGTTAEGIHAGVMAGTIYITLTTYGGVDIRQKQLTIDPKLPASWEKMRFNLNRRGVHYQVAIDRSQLVITASQDTWISVKGQEIFLEQNQAKAVTYNAADIVKT